MSANSRTSSIDARSIEFESPNVQTNASTICIVVLYSSANLTALSESRKQSINASANVIIILGFLAHPRKLYDETVQTCFKLRIAEPPRYADRETQRNGGNKYGEHKRVAPSAARPAFRRAQPLLWVKYVYVL